MCNRGGRELIIKETSIFLSYSVHALNIESVEGVINNNHFSLLAFVLACQYLYLKRGIRIAMKGPSPAPEKRQIQCIKFLQARRD